MKKIIYILGILAFFLSSTSFAYYFGPRHIFDTVNNSIAIGLNLMHLNYREAAKAENSSIPKDNIENYGNAFGVFINYRNLFFDNWIFGELNGEYLTGSITYDGFSIVKVEEGPQEEYRFEESIHKNLNSFINLDMKVGPVIFNSEYFQVIPYIGLGFHYWKQSQIYSYRHFKALVGGKVNIALFNDLVLSPFFNYGKTLMPRANADVGNNKGEFVESVTHKIKSKDIMEVGLEFNYRWDNEIFLTGAISHTHFEYGRSDGIYVKGVGKAYIEPNSKTNELRFSLGIRFGFL